METIVREKGKVSVAMVHPEILNYTERYQYLYGGRGGGKSKTVARILPLLSWQNPGLVSLVTRKTFPSLRVTAMQDTLDAIEQMKIPGMYYASSPFHFQFANGSIIHFQPLHIGKTQNERLKSLDLNIAWMEEPTECTKKDFETLDPAVRLPGIRRWYFTFNPPESSNHWIYGNYDRQKAAGKARRVHFALEDNPLLPEDTVKALDDLKNYDIGLYKRFRAGEWGINVKRKRVWDNVHIGKIERPPHIWIGGIDFGWSNPSSAHLYGVEDQRIDVVDEVYGSHMKTEVLGEKIKAMLQRNHLNPREVPFAADSNYPEKIHELQDMGLWIIAAVKGKGSVEAGITEVRKYIIYVDEDRCPNAWRELPGYIYPEDAHGNILEEPAKINDHCPDELRYAVYTILKRMRPWVGQEETVELAESAL